jgi:hypothetical protein
MLGRSTCRFMELITLMQAVFNRPPLPFDANRQPLKGWAKYCLQDRGFKLVYAANADFAIESRGEKFYFNVTTQAENLEPQVGWIVVDPSGQTANVIPPQVEKTD